jgi:two-component system sensor histidine kinase UhpB
MVAIGGVIAAGGISAWLTRIALSPLEAIEETADRVRAGDFDARAPSSPLADERLDRVGSILNEMLDALDRARRRQRQLSLQVLRSQERERGRMSGDLYDRTAQTLAGVLVRLNLLNRDDPDAPRSEGLAFVTEQVRDALEEVRAVARRLRPPELNDLGVRSALEALGRELDEEYDLLVSLEGDLPESRLTEDARLALFRVVQEALLNVALHASAHRALVTFNPKPGEVLVEVQDDGVGFEPADLGGEGDPRLGLVTMIERAGYARGRITVESSPGLGTRIRLVFPLDEERTHREDVPGEVLVGEAVAGLLTPRSNSAQGGPHVP